MVGEMAQRRGTSCRGKDSLYEEPQVKQLPRTSLYGIHQEGTWPHRAFRGIYPKSPVSVEDSLDAPWRDERCPPPCRPSAGLHLGETSETGLCFPGPFSPSLLCGRGMVLL